MIYARLENLPHVLLPSSGCHGTPHQVGKQDFSATPNVHFISCDTIPVPMFGFLPADTNWHIQSSVLNQDFQNGCHQPTRACNTACSLGHPMSIASMQYSDNRSCFLAAVVPCTTNYQMYGPVNAGRRWGQRHPQGASLASNGIFNFLSKTHTMAATSPP